ncbi:hypothetical protein [Neptunicella sp. SCSIO 80796]|uniref:hypothetical protein n=1 Tax=Neptunicella plasticusilytica TaxID=3117012 RepID=UPI003A4E47A6
MTNLSKLINNICLAIIACFLSTASATEVETDKQAVLKVADKIFDAVSSGNPDDWRALQLAEGVNIALIRQKDSDNQEYAMRLVTNEAFASKVSPSEHHYIERWTETPTVLLEGPMAVIWGRYEFLIDGKLSHCGIDSIDLVKQDGQWKVANVIWTMLRDECE